MTIDAYCYLFRLLYQTHSPLEEWFYRDYLILDSFIWAAKMMPEGQLQHSAIFGRDPIVLGRGIR